MIDLTRLNSITDNDTELNRKLLTLFNTTTRRVLVDMEQGNGEWRMLVHELKGAAANLGFTAMADTCRILEHNEPQGAEREAFFAQIRMLITEVEALIA